MYDQRQRRRARAIAISESIESRGKAIAVRALMALGLAFGLLEAGFALRHVIATH